MQELEREGFEPSKPEAADLQSAGFDRSPTSPQQAFSPHLVGYAGTKSRTRDLLITNQLLYQLSYAGSGADCTRIYTKRNA